MKRASWFLALVASLCFALPQLAIAEDQPHMQAALQHLQMAKEELQKAEHDKGGHREAALKQVDTAIQQVQQGMRFDERHDKDKKEEKREHQH